MRRIKLLKRICLILIILYTLWKLNINLNGAVKTYETSINSPIYHNSLKNSCLGNESKLLTLSTSFVDISNRTSNEETAYRYRAQLNFLKTTQFPSFQTYINFIVFTEDAEWVTLIRSEYLNVKVLPSPSLIKFAPPMIRDIFLNTMQSYDSTFYMFANADNVYDFSLIQTVRGVLRAVNQGRIRSKLLIVGQRYDLNYKGVIRDQNQVRQLIKYAIVHPPVAKDYFIVTKDSFEWELFPDFFIGRRWYDSYIVQNAFFNEVELIDATPTIRMIHQIKRVGYWSSLNAEASLNDWNLSLLGVDTHSSIKCARYTTKTPFSEVGLIDKQQNFDYFISSPLIPFHNQLVADILRLKQTKSKSNFLVIILACDRPNSLNRLLLSLSEAHYGEEKVDLMVLLDIGRTGAFDIEVLKILNKFSWNSGNFDVLMEQKHAGALQQWILAWNISFSQRNQTLILEDDVVLSPYFYKVLKSAFSAYSKVSYLAGFSLDLPSTLRDNIIGHVESNIVLSDYHYSRAFSPHPKFQKQFIEWYSEYSRDYILMEGSTGYHNYHSLFKLYVISQNIAIGYLMDYSGDFATRAFFTILGNEEFLLDSCYLFEKSTIAKERPLTINVPQGFFPEYPPSIP